VDNLTADPALADPNGLNFRFACDPRAIDAGTSSQSATVDLEGVSRPEGNQYDMGAHERLPANIDDDGNTHVAVHAALAGSSIRPPGAEGQPY